MPVFIDPRLNELLQNLERNTFKNHTFHTDEDTLENEDYRNNNLETIRITIQQVRQKIDRRIQNNTPENHQTWDNNAPQYHILKEDYELILKTLIAICPGCNESIREIQYTARTTEYGTAYFNIVNGTTDHETTNTENDDGYDYECPDCGRDIDPETVPFYFPENALELIKTMLRTDIANGATNDPLGFNTATQVKRKTNNKQANFFPPGRQVQRDIGAHGPNGPQMRMTSSGKIKISFTEDFAFRNNNKWKCKHCENFNEGTRQKCTNKTCQKDKFEPIKAINLT